MTPEYEIVSVKPHGRNKWQWAFWIIALIVIALLAWMFLSRPDKPAKTPSVAAPVSVPVKPVQTYRPYTPGSKFDDGLHGSSATTKHKLDEFGVGLASTEVFNIDINGDSRKDRITKSKHENGTDHFWYEYKIELNTKNGFIDITPDDFRTIEGADCSLQKIRFVFAQTLQVIKISRPWSETWVTPTVATQTTYTLSGGVLRVTDTRKLRNICNVSELFN